MNSTTTVGDKLQATSDKSKQGKDAQPATLDPETLRALIDLLIVSTNVTKGVA